MNTYNWLKPDWPVSSNIQAVSTTRLAGESQGPYASMNLALHVGDNVGHVLENRAFLKSALQLKAEPSWLKQTHSNRVLNTEDITENNNDGDASISFSKNKTCVVMTADCLPVLFANKQGTKVAAAHAGWRGLADGVLEKTLAAFDETPKSILAWLGPAIGANSFEVGEEVRAAFMRNQPRASEAFKAQISNKYLADIYALARMRLNHMGLTEIYGGEFDTMDDERFFSYRANNTTGRMASLIWMET